MGGSSSKKNYRRAPRNIPPRRNAMYDSSPAYQQPPPPIPLNTRPSIQGAIRLPPQREPVYEPPMEPIYLDDDGGDTCPYGWIFSIMSCLMSLCILISLVIFIVWFIMSGRNVRIE